MLERENVQSVVVRDGAVAWEECVVSVGAGVAHAFLDEVRVVVCDGGVEFVERFGHDAVVLGHVGGVARVHVEVVAADYPPEGIV